MIWKCRKSNAAERAKRLWHDWFAWYPVRVPTKGRMSGKNMVWFQTVKRKGIAKLNFFKEYTIRYWEYK